MRERYETDADLKAEEKAKERMEKVGECLLHKLPDSYSADFLVIKDDKPVAICEFKKRNIAYGQYPEVLLSLGKYHRCWLLAQHLRVPLVFAVDMQGILYRAVLKDEYPITWGGRTVQTRDSSDVEPVIMIPMSEFKKV